MINDLDIVQWDYLLSPEFEMVNSAGKPLTGGYIEVYIHGTRNKYYCASDFNGTLHPFQIPLDSLGSNIVLASPDNAYDVYVYNKYGSLIMSRYNVHCQGTGGGGGSYAGDKLFYGQYTAHNVAETASLSKTKGNINLDSDGYLQLEQGMSYHITVRGAFQVNDVTNTETTLNYIEYSTISPIKVDVDFTKADPQNFELSYDIYDLAEDMAYQVAFEQINGMVTDLVVEVHSLSNLATTATFNYEAGDYISIVDNTISVTGINPEDYSTHSETYESIVTAIQLVTGIVPDDAATHGEVYEATVTAINFVTGAIPIPEPELPLVAGDGITITEFEDRVEIAANVTSIDGYATLNDVAESAITSIQLVTGLIPDVSDYATHDEVNTVSGEIIETVNNVSSVLHEEMIEIGQTVTGLIPDVSDFATHEDLFESAVTSIQLVTGLIPDVSDYATRDEVNESIATAIDYVTGIIPEAQVQSDWTETDTEDPAYIQHKPDEYSLIAGQNIGIDIDYINHNIVISASAIPVVTGYATNSDVYEATVTAIEYVTGIIPEAQVQSDWTETDNTDPSYIQNKPNEYTIVAGNNIGIMIDNNDLVISASSTDLTDYVTEEELQDSIEIVTAIIPDVSDFVTNNEVYEATVTAINTVTSIIPEAQVQSNWTETDNADPSYIQNKPNTTNLVAGDGIIITESSNDLVISCAVTSVSGYVTEEELQDSIEVVTGLIPDVSDFVTEAQVTAMLPEEEEVEFLAVEAGSGINIVQSATGITISCSVTGGGDSYTAGNGIDITNNEISVDNTVALKTDIPVVTGFATKTELQAATGMIPEYTAGDYISIENNEIAVTGTEDLTLMNLEAGQNISITLSGSTVEIACTGIPDVTNYATHAEVNNVSGAIVNEIPDVSDFVTEAQVTALIPEEEEVDFLAVSGGNCIEITSDVSGAEIAWHTTAGITDIQMVTALPASPVSSILYIIPEA